MQFFIIIIIIIIIIMEFIVRLLHRCITKVNKRKMKI